MKNGKRAVSFILAVVLLCTSFAGCGMVQQDKAYLERVAVNSVKHINQAKKAIEKAFRNQVEGKGFSLIEVLSTCPTNWGMTPDQAMQWVEEKMIPYYPLGVYKDIYAEEAAK